MQLPIVTSSVLSFRPDTPCFAGSAPPAVDKGLHAPPGSSMQKLPALSRTVVRAPVLHLSWLSTPSPAQCTTSLRRAPPLPNCSASFSPCQHLISCTTTLLPVQSLLPRLCTLLPFPSLSAPSCSALMQALLLYSYSIKAHHHPHRSSKHRKLFSAYASTHAAGPSTVEAALD